MALEQIEAIFYKTEADNEPVREWLRSLTREDRKVVGDAIRRVEFRWPVGMPVSRPLGGGLHEVRVRLTTDRIARVIFYVSATERMILLNGFVNKTRQTPPDELALATERMQRHKRNV